MGRRWPSARGQCASPRSLVLGAKPHLYRPRAVLIRSDSPNIVSESDGPFVRRSARSAANSRQPSTTARFRPCRGRSLRKETRSESALRIYRSISRTVDPIYLGRTLRIRRSLYRTVSRAYRLS